MERHVVLIETGAALDTIQNDRLVKMIVLVVTGKALLLVTVRVNLTVVAAEEYMCTSDRLIGAGTKCQTSCQGTSRVIVDEVSYTSCRGKAIESAKSTMRPFFHLYPPELKYQCLVPSSFLSGRSLEPNIDPETCCCLMTEGEECRYEIGQLPPQLTDIVNQCTGNQICEVPIPILLPNCTSRLIGNIEQKISYTCTTGIESSAVLPHFPVKHQWLRAPSYQTSYDNLDNYYDVCTQRRNKYPMDDEEGASLFYITFNKNQRDSDGPLDCGCSITVLSGDGKIEIPWLLGSGFRPSCSTKVKVETADLKTTWQCGDGSIVPDREHVYDINGLYSPRIAGEHVTVTINSPYTPGPGTDRLWIAVKVPDDIEVILECGQKDTPQQNAGDSKIRNDGLKSDNDDNGSGSKVAIVVAVVTSLTILVIVAVVLIVICWWKRKNKNGTLESTPATYYTHGYPETEIQDSIYTTLSRENSTYATINDINMDSDNYSRISVKSNEYNKSNSLNNAEISLNPTYNRLQQNVDYSRIRNGLDKDRKNVMQDPYNRAQPGYDEYDHTTDKKSSSDRSIISDYNQIKLKENGSYSHSLNVNDKCTGATRVDDKDKQMNDIDELPLPFSSDLGPRKERPTIHTEVEAKLSEPALPLARSQNCDTESEGSQSDSCSERSNTSKNNTKYKVASQTKADGFESTNPKVNNNSEKPNNEYETAIVKINSDITNDGYETSVVKVINHSDITKDGIETTSVTENNFSEKTNDGYETTLINNDSDITNAGYETTANKKNNIFDRTNDGYETSVMKLDNSSGISKDGYETAVTIKKIEAD